MKRGWIISTVGLLLFSCIGKNHNPSENRTIFTGETGEIKLNVLAPGHFHASLLQKSAIPQVNDSVFVYAATKDAGLEQYLDAIHTFNQRDTDPTRWEETVYIGENFLERMVADKRGNVVVLAGNNRDKTEYILAAIDAGLHVLSDKPMAINQEDFFLLEEAYSNAEAKEVLLYDMMTERYDLLNIIEKELVNDVDFFGELQPGTPEEPAVYMESVHHFYKEVAGAPLIRPAWYYDVEQQGEGIADVTTHLIDQLFWKCFPGQSIDHKQDIGSISSTHWPTEITLPQFSRSTGETGFPEYLQKHLDNGSLKVFANGTIHFDVKGHHAGLKVLWNWQAPQGSGDTFMSEIKGTQAILRTEQGKAQGFVKQLYAKRPSDIEKEQFEENLKAAITSLQPKYPFLSYTLTGDEDIYLINIPIENRESHESHFKYVGERFFQYLVDRDMPEWEKTTTLAKYYITTRAVEFAKE